MPMIALRSVTGRSGRTVSLGLIGVLFVVLLAYSAQTVVRVSASSALGATWAWYATYVIIGALFFGVGSLVWLYNYAKQPIIAFLLFCFCDLVMFAFGTLSGAELGDPFSNALGSSVSALAVLSLFFLLQRFPRPRPVPQRAVVRWVMRLGQVAVVALCALSVSYSILDIFFPPLPGWWHFLGALYYGVVSLLIVLIIVFAARTPSVRELQQTRLFLAGTLLSFIPIVFLTILPTLLHLGVGVDGSRSMIFLVFFPISIAYALLRYELFVPDEYIKKVVTWVISGMGLLLLGYLLFAGGSQLLGSTTPLALVGLVAAGVFLAPLVWWQAGRLTERYFFPEAAFYATRLRELHIGQGLETFDLELAAHQLVLDVTTTLRSPETCLFLLDDETQSFDLLSLPHKESRNEQARTSLLSQLERLLSAHEDEATPRIAASVPALALLTTSSRPLFSSELTEEHAPRLARYLKRRASGASPDPLLAPMRTLQGKLVGIVAISERGDQQVYAGPELEALQRVIDRATPVVETARLYELATRQQAASTRELAQAYEQQRELGAMKDELIIHMSHELRTPLTEVAGYLDLLQEMAGSLDPAMQASFVGKAQHGCAELLSLVETILHAAETGSTVAPPSNEIVSLHEVVQAELNYLESPLIPHHRIRQENEGDQVFAWANTQSVHQVVRNLLSNACKYAPADTTIMVSMVEDEQGVCLLVRDEGPGIPPAELPLLFGKFVRIKRDLSGTIRGTGLGLYICKQLVQAMGGQIWAESRGIPGEGSCFFVRLQSNRDISFASGAEPGEPSMVGRSS